MADPPPPAAQSPRSAGLRLLNPRAEILTEVEQSEKLCRTFKWGHHLVRVTDHGIEMQRTRGPFDIKICTQKQSVGIPHAKIGRFRTTWSSASLMKPVQFLIEGLGLGLLYSMIKNDTLSPDSIQVAGCDVTDIEAYEQCAGAVRIDVGMVNQEHVRGDTGKIMLFIAWVWFLSRTVTWVLSRVAMLEVYSDGCPEEDTWVYFPGEQRDRLQKALMDQQYKLRGFEGSSTDGVDGRNETEWNHRGASLIFGRHHMKVINVNGMGSTKGTEEVMATYDSVRFLHLAIAGRTCRQLFLGSVLLSVGLGICTFVFVQASGAAADGLAVDNAILKADYNAAELKERLVAGAMAIGFLYGLWTWTQSAVSFAEFGIDFESGTSNTKKALSAAGMAEQTVRVPIPKQYEEEMKATYLHRQLYPDNPSRQLLKRFRGHTGDDMSLSMLSIYEDRVELEIQSYCHWKFFASCRGLCRYCEKGESYIVLLRDIEYVKTGYIGSPILYYAGWFMCVGGFLVMAVAPSLVAMLGSSTPSAISGVAVSSYANQQKILLTTLAVCEGLALLLWTWYLWKKRSVIHLGVTPGGGEHGKINPYGSASPFFIVFKTLKDQQDDEIMAAILAQRDRATEKERRDKSIRVVRQPEEPPPPVVQPQVAPVLPPTTVVQPRPQPVRDWRNAINAAELPMAWKRLKDGKGRDYFFNTITKKSQWTVPDEIAKEQKEQAASWEPGSAAKVEIEI